MEEKDYDQTSHVMELEMRVRSLEICLDRILKINPPMISFTKEQVEAIREEAFQKVSDRFKFLGLKKSELPKSSDNVLK